MNCSLSSVRWFRILAAAVAVIALSFLILTLITTVYALGLAIHNRGTPDQAAISHFASRTGRWLMPWLEALLTTLAAAVVARRTDNSSVIHGLFVGIVAGLLGMAMTLTFGGHLNLRTICLFLIVVGMGWLGGFVGRKKSGHNENVV
jgi:hypothetical protein